MSKETTYNISLKGYVGGLDFDRSTVDKTLAKNEGKEVNVLIDSLGGSFAIGLSISAAFKHHGQYVAGDYLEFVTSPTTSTMKCSCCASDMPITDASCSCMTTIWEQITTCSAQSDP